jgi:hypothetical protein
MIRETLHIIGIAFRFVFPKRRKVRAYEQGDTAVYTFVKDSEEKGGYRKIQCPFKESECKVSCAYYSIKRGKVRCGKHVIGKLR